MDVTLGEAAQIVTSLCVGVGVITTVAVSQNYLNEKIDELARKQDKHNGLIERMAIVEQSTKSAHHRIDEASSVGSRLVEAVAELRQFMEDCNESKTNARACHKARSRKN